VFVTFYCQLVAADADFAAAAVAIAAVAADVAVAAAVAIAAALLMSGVRAYAKHGEQVICLHFICNFSMHLAVRQTGQKDEKDDGERQHHHQQIVLYCTRMHPTVDS